MMLLVGGCGATQMRGGHVIPRGQEPRGKVLLRYESTGCVDRAGQSATSDFGNVWLVRVGEGRDVLVSTTPGYDSVVIDNEFVVAGERVFQLSIEAGPDRDVLLDYRLPVVGDGPGRLAIARNWLEVRGKQPVVRAYFEQAVLACRLESVPLHQPARGDATARGAAGEKSE